MPGKRRLLRRGKTSVTLLCNAESHTLAGWQRDERLLATDDEDVAETSGERVVSSILDVDNVKGAVVTLTVGDVTHTSQVTTSDDHDQVASVKRHNFRHLASGNIDLDCVVGLDQWVRVTDGATVVGNEVWHTLVANSKTADTAKLVLKIGKSKTHQNKTISISVVLCVRWVTTLPSTNYKIQE